MVTRAQTWAGKGVSRKFAGIGNPAKAGLKPMSPGVNFRGMHEKPEAGETR